MQTDFILDDAHLSLHRYPPGQKTRSLVAWDAADELLIRYTKAHPPTGSLTILNDQFGALACALHQYAPHCISDSYISQLATRFNWQQNNLSELPLLHSLSPMPVADLVLLKIPSNHGLLRAQLRALKQVLPASARVVASAKAKDIHANLLAIFNEELGPTQASLTEKKCRLITATIQGSVNRHPSGHFPICWPLTLPTGQEVTLANHANVFSREQLDQGARFLLEHLPSFPPRSQCIDLGCGNGVLSVAMLLQQPDLDLIACDESYMAVESTRLNIAQNCPQTSGSIVCLVDDTLKQQADASADWIICNPPFHQQHAVTDHVAWQMFLEARRVLRVGGRLRIVCNSHLDYGDKLSRVFGGYSHIASNAKFSIFESVKRKP